MIAYLEGKIIAKEKGAITLLTESGVGYEVRLAPLLWAKQKEGDSVHFYTHQQVREDSQELFGLANRVELFFFKQLLSVSGVGPKSALNILSLGTVEEIKTAIAKGDLTFLTKVSGIGRKTAERIIVELKEKMDILAGGDDDSSGLSDVIDALTNLGYSVNEARAAIKNIKKTDDAGAMLKEALKNLRKH